MADNSEQKLAYFEGIKAPEYPLPDRNYVTLILEQLEKRAEETLYVQLPEKRRVTCGEVRQKSMQVGSGLAKSLQPKKGDVACICSYNIPEFIEAWYGSTLAGMTVMLCNTGYTHEEMHQQLLDGECTVLFTPGDNKLLQKALKAVKDSNVKKIVLLTEPESKEFVEEAKSFGIDLVSMHSLCQQGQDEHIPEVSWNWETDIASIGYSCGTSGKPKGVYHTHAGLRFYLKGIALFKSMMLKCEGLSGPEKTFCMFPMCHWYGLVMAGMYVPYLSGSVYIQSEFNFEALLKAIQDDKITEVYLLAGNMIQLAKDPVARSYDLNSIKTIMMGGAHMPKEQFQALYSLFDREKPPQILQGYGAIECGAVMMPPGAPPEIVKVGSKCRK